MDIIAEFEPGCRLTLLDMVAIENRLTELLGVRVDLSPAKTLKKPVRDKGRARGRIGFLATIPCPAEEVAYQPTCLPCAIMKGIYFLPVRKVAQKPTP